VINNRYVPGKTKLGLSVVMFCACEKMQLFSIIFLVVTAVHKFDSTRDNNETQSEWGLVFAKT